MLEYEKNPQCLQEIDENRKQSQQSLFTIGQQNLRESYESPPQITQTQKLAIILNKPYEFRTVLDNQLITNFIKQNIMLQKLSQEISLQFVKDIMKISSLITPGKNKIICNKGDKIKYIGIVLTGQLAIISQSERNITISPEIGYDEMLTNLFENAKNHYSDFTKKFNHLSLTASRKLKEQCQIIDTHFQHLYQPYKLKIQSYLNQNQLFGFVDRSLGDKYTKTSVSLNKQTTLLVFNEVNVMMSLEAAFKEKQQKTIAIMKGIPCFNFLDNNRINLIIQSIAIRKKKKPFIIYHQGDCTSYFYILTEGEIKIKKQTNVLSQTPKKALFKESFLTKVKTIEKMERNNKYEVIKNTVHPYISHPPLFNFNLKPLKKSLEIGIVTPVCLFGEEQYIDKKNRETTAICISLQTEYFEISVQKLESILGPKLLPIFCQLMQESSQRKRLYHKSLQKTVIDLEKKNSFKLPTDDDQNHLPSPIKHHQHKLFNGIIQNKIQISPHKTKGGNFAFSSLDWSNLNKSQNKLKKLNQSASKDRQITDWDPNQKKIIQVSHTWKFMKEKIDKQIEAMKKISPIKFSINFKKPLLSSDFFIQMDKQSRRIQRQHRKRVTSLSNTFKIRNIKQKSDVLLKD